MSRPFPSPRLTGVCLIAAAVLLQIGYLVTPWESEGTTASYHAALAGHPTQAQIAATFLHFGWVAWAPAAFGIVALLAPRGGWLLKIGGTLAIVGTVSLPGLLVVDFYDLALAQELPSAQAVEVSDKASGYGLQALFQVPAVAGAILGTLLLLFALWRASWAPAWVPFAAVAGYVVVFALPVGLLPFAIGGSLTMVACCCAGVRLVRGDGPDVRETAKPLPTDVPAPAAA
ncbi:hypothetical protein [Conexibacter woesei]|uniref:DUF4386 domain-containing protein n=1 Tax=Conexibacter woesei (strain DSM 14684 / CCUG 47730 / CIP 108061 / JCM 11494 / NBRC 100937 / ID131577) TaxID=469383 RepID=D3FC64_CONWI|nr:hypothetical protein [Conexibacter woesei]ADB53359.1 hypothetical protein Cwoe_4948 [Conexibacter woesei DSM 14684]